MRICLALGALASICVLSVSAPVAGAQRGDVPTPTGPVVPPSLLAAAQANPQQTFHVIVMAGGRGQSGALLQNVANWAAQSESSLQNAANAANTAFQSAESDDAQAQAANVADAVRAKLTGRKADKLAAADAARAFSAAQNALAQAQNQVSAAQAAFGNAAVSIATHHVKDQFNSITGVAMTLTGEQITGIVGRGRGDVVSITPDATLDAADYSTVDGYENAEMWRDSVDASSLWDQPAVTCTIDPLTGLQIDPTCVPAPAFTAPQAPAIAIVDSGIDATKAADFGDRVVASVDLSSLDPNDTTDGEGHGTMVAGIAAGAANSVTPGGVAQNAPLVDVHVADAQGQSMTSDVVAACDWILANKDQYDIRVANFSLVAPQETTFMYDPLDQAVENLWLNGVVVTAAAGNEGTGSAINMSTAPGNDPFIITVGALDQNGTATTADDTVAPWSAFGATDDGFWKPDISAPGRYLIMPVPDGAYIPSQVPERDVAPGYMWMSGTSFASPMVAGAAAQVLAYHPDWTPDQVKGALMVSADALPLVSDDAGGVGELDVAGAVAVTDPPNPNAGLDQFITTDPSTGDSAFDSAAWSSAAWSSAAWNSAAWSSAAWSSAAWSSAAWSSAAWSSAAWSSAAWSSAAWDSASWSSASWSSANWLP